MKKKKKIDGIDYCKAIAIFATLFDHVCLGCLNAAASRLKSSTYGTIPMFLYLPA